MVLITLLIAKRRLFNMPIKTTNLLKKIVNWTINLSYILIVILELLYNLKPSSKIDSIWDELH